MTYDEKIPEYALQPAKAADETQEEKQADDGFDPTPYDRLLTPAAQEQEQEQEQGQEIRATEAPGQQTEPSQMEKNTQPKEAQDNREAEEEIEPVRLSEEPFENPAAPAAEPLKITPMAGSAVYSDLKLKTVVQKLQTKVFIEEDILVPDIKPDLITVLSMDGKASLSSKEIQVGKGENDSIRITGEVELQTIYLPDGKTEGETICMIQSRLPFKTDWQLTASPMSHLSITPTVENVDYTVINERKFRAKLTLTLSLKEYAQREMQLFESLRNEKLELLKEPVRMSHVAFRKEEPVEIAEDLKLREGSLKPVKILKSDINVVENHKQITSEKMVINATIWANVLYSGTDEADSEGSKNLALFQGKTDFTQFILMDKEENVAASQVTFSDRDLELKINEEEGDCFSLKGAVNTSVVVYQNLEKEVVADLYHNTRDTTYDVTERTVEAIMGMGSTEASAREIFTIPEQSGQADKVIYVNGRVKEKNSSIEQGRVMIEGILEGQILCLPEEEEKRPIAVRQEIPFRGSIEIPAAQGGMKVESKADIRDLWVDKINGKQIEVNASLLIEATVIEEKALKLIKNPCFVEDDLGKRLASMVVYITKRDDTFWKIAKKYKTSIKAIKRINQLEDAQGIAEGMRLLIVK